MLCPIEYIQKRLKQYHHLPLNSSNYIITLVHVSCRLYNNY